MQWRNPPRQRLDWGRIATRLQANPGKWALVAQSHGSNTCPPLRKRGVKVQSHRVADGKFDLYAMFPGAE